MKRLGIIILTLIMSVNLAACSIKDVIGNSDDPNVGVWNAVTASMMGIDSDVAEMFEKGVTLELKAQGKYDMMMDGKKTNGKWSYKDGDLKLSQKGVDFSGHIENSLLILTDMLDIGLDLTFQREGGYAGVAYPENTVTTASEEVGSYKLEEAIEDGETITGEELRAMGFDYYVLINDDGTVVFQTDDLATGTWENGILDLQNEEGGTATLSYEIEGDKLTIDWDGLIMIFIRSSDVSTEQTVNSGGLSKVQQWWHGDWYGYWEVHSVTDDYKDMEDERWECYAEIQMNSDDTGSIYLWEKSGDIAVVDITVSQDGGSGEMGAAFSESGHNWNDEEIGHADWIIDPSLYDYENYMVIDGRYEDEDGGGFYYLMYLRPWGQLWDDIPEDERPPDYDDWYLDNYTADSMTETVLASITDYDGYDDSEIDGPDAEEPAPPGSGGGTVDAIYEMEGVSISAMLPIDWCSEKNAFGVNFYNVADLKDTHSGSPRIRVNIKPEVKDFDIYIKDFENIQSIQNRTIGGIDMAGRTYEFVGMDWIEYTGVIDNAHAVSVSISKIDISDGEARGVLDSIKLE